MNGKITKEIHRQIRYNKKTDIGEQTSLRYEYVFLIVNTPEETGRIKERIFDVMKPDDVVSIENFVIPSTNGLHCDVFSFLTNAGAIENPCGIYRSGKFRRDRDLIVGNNQRILSYVQSRFFTND